MNKEMEMLREQLARLEKQNEHKNKLIDQKTNQLLENQEIQISKQNEIIKSLDVIAQFLHDIKQKNI